MRIIVYFLTLFLILGSSFASASVSEGNGVATGNWLKSSPGTRTPSHPSRTKTIPNGNVKQAANTGYAANIADGNIDFSLVGYATLTGGTTGGAGGNTITVTTGTELQAALTAKIKQTTPLIIYVAGKITPENSPGLTKIDIKDLKDVSVLGVGTSGEFDGIGIKIYKASNVIVRNVKVHHVRIGDKDCISIEGPAHHIWIDHCELYNEFQGVNKDYYDALLDAKAESEYITFSWNYLHDSWKASLAGSSESDTYDRKITYHHNYFRNLNSRLPLFRGGNGHVFNNYYKDVVETAINSRIGACLKIENNYFLNVNNPYVSAYSTVVGYGDISGNILVDSPFKYTTDEKELGTCVSNIPYTYAHALHTAEEVPAIVEMYAGVGIIDVLTDTGTPTQPQPTTYQLTTSVTGQGTVSPSGGIYAEGSSVTLQATPASGWEFSGWSGGATGTINPLTISMTSNKTIAAAFTQTSTGGNDGGDGGSAGSGDGTTGTNYYVSLTGDDAGTGTIGSPFRSIQHAIAQAAPGDYIYVRGGVYNEPVGINIARGNDGTAGAPKRLFAYQGEVPVLNFSAQAEISSNRGLTMNGNYWHVKGLIVEEAGDNGIFIGGNNNTVESTITRRNKDTGLQLGRYSSAATVAEWPSNNLILNCESYDNKDSGNENADGFAAKLTTGPGNVFRGCVAHHNIDDGWDLYTKTDTGPIGAVTLEDCIAHSNGTLTTGGTSGNGDKNGFKLGGEDIAVNHIVRRCIAFNNGKHGFTYNRNTGSIEMTNNTGYNNAQRNFTFDVGTHVYKNNLSFQSASNDKVIGTMAGPNSFTNGASTFSVTTASFQNLTPGPDANPTSNGFLHLATGSPLIDAGVASAGITYKGAAPDLGAVESDGTTTTPAGYTLTVTASPANGGTITRNPDKSSYAAGEVVTLTATAATGYTFSNWSGAASGTTATATVTINGNTSAGATFTATNAGGGGTPTGPAVRIDNTATPATGLCIYDGTFRLVGSVNVVNLSNSAGKGITWKVEVPAAGDYSLTWRYAGGGSTAAETAKLLVNKATALESVSFPKPANSTSFLTTAPVTVALGKGVNEIRVETTVATAFADIEWIEVTGNNPVATDCSNEIGSGGGEPAPVMYTLAATSNPANGGIVTLSPEADSYEEGTTVTATATPADGWLFSGWSGDASGTANTTEVNMSSNKAIVANFYQITTERISASATQATGLCSNESGSIRLVNGTPTLNLSNTAGRGVNWKVEVPAAGTYTLQWRYAGGGSTAQESARLLINGTIVNEAVAFPKPANSTSFLTTDLVPVTLGNGVNEIRIEVIQSLAMGDIEWIEITGNGPKATDCSNEIGSGGGSTPAPASYTLTATSNPDNGGTVTFSPAGGTYTDGTQVTVTATPESGFSFTGWSGDASGTSATATIVMNSNKSVTAAFTQNTTGPEPNPGPAPSNEGMAGFATVSGEGYTTTTGGEGGQIITISTLAQLQTWALSRENKTTPEIVYVSGKIEASSSTVVTIKHGANVSVIGIGSTAELMNVGLNFRNYKNVIVRNLKIHEVFYPNDALTIDQCQHVWVDHNEFHSKIGAGIGVDTYDGLLDIKNGSRYVTVSWNYFHEHMKTVLIGHTDNTSAEAVDREIRVTFHHNYFENTDGRNPSLRWGAVHMYNNYLKDITDYGIAARQGAHALLENNVYENVKLPMSTNKFTGEGYICERGNLFTGTSGANSITQTDCDWWNASTLPYAYTLEDASTLAATLPALVGVGKLDGGGSTDPQPVTHQLTTSVTGQGEVTSGGTFDEGTTTEITATPASGWKFSGWSGDATGTDNPLVVTMSGSKSIVATFTQIQHQLTTSVTGQGEVTAGGTYNEGEIVSLTATPAAGWQFAGWSGDASGTVNPLDVTMSSSKTVTATFTEITYELTTATTGNGRVSTPGSTHKTGTEVTLTATPETHWKFEGWSGDATGTANPLTFVMNSNKTVEAIFTEIVYDLSTTVTGQGSLSSTRNISQRTATLTATPETGWKFTGWSGDASGTTNPLTITMDADKAVTANFARIEYNLIVTKQGEGTVNLTQGTYNVGETAQLTATPAAGYEFAGWSGSASGTANPLLVTMDSDKTIVANFSVKGSAPAKEVTAIVYPNPFSGSATFEFTLIEKSKVKISLFAYDGTKVADILTSNKVYSAGTHSIRYTNTKLKPGIYIYVVEADRSVFRDQVIVE